MCINNVLTCFNSETRIVGSHGGDYEHIGMVERHSTLSESGLCGLIVRVRVVPRRTVVGDIDILINVTNNSPSRDYSHPDDQTTQTTETPGFKPFTVCQKGRQDFSCRSACHALPALAIMR